MRHSTPWPDFVVDCKMCFGDSFGGVRASAGFRAVSDPKGKEIKGFRNVSQGQNVSLTQRFSFNEIFSVSARGPGAYELGTSALRIALFARFRAGVDGAHPILRSGEEGTCEKTVRRANSYVVCSYNRSRGTTVPLHWPPARNPSTLAAPWSVRECKCSPLLPSLLFLQAILRRLRRPGSDNPYC